MNIARPAFPATCRRRHPRGESVPRVPCHDQPNRFLLHFQFRPVSP